KLLEILVCPVTKGPLEYDAEKQELISRSAKLAYPIRPALPIMRPAQPRKLRPGPRCIFSFGSCNENLRGKSIHQSRADRSRAGYRPRVSVARTQAAPVRVTQSFLGITTPGRAKVWAPHRRGPRPRG